METGDSPKGKNRFWQTCGLPYVEERPINLLVFIVWTENLCDFTTNPLKFRISEVGIRNKQEQPGSKQLGCLPKCSKLQCARTLKILSQHLESCSPIFRRATCLEKSALIRMQSYNIEGIISHAF